MTNKNKIAARTPLRPYPKFMSTSLSVIVAAIAVIVALSGLHTIPEGHVGLYWRGGALMERTSRAGFHWKIPLLEGHSAVQVTVQTDSVTNIPCGTSGGVLIDFAKVEVVNRLRSPMVHATVKITLCTTTKCVIPMHLRAHTHTHIPVLL